MVHALPIYSRSASRSLANAERAKSRLRRKKSIYGRLIFLVGVAVLAPLLLAQGNPQVTGVDPAMGKVNDSVTIAGQNLDKTTVAAVFLSEARSSGLLSEGSAGLDVRFDVAAVTIDRGELAIDVIESAF